MIKLKSFNLNVTLDEARTPSTYSENKNILHFNNHNEEGRGNALTGQLCN